MRLARNLLLAVLLGGLAVAAPASDASAQAKKPAAKAAAKKPTKKGAKPPPEEEAPEVTEAAEKAEVGKGKGEGQVKSAETGAGGPKVTETKGTEDGGVKTYTFGPVEVEGRLKSPQVIYFLRRVRAEFAAGDLGHRSFLREMSDTRRNPAIR
ncbi:MAG: hypothetical protein KF718_00595 [Polyangiaceae bacterium]|nr:hypothetical protein [Polyangiaceae bacterium]